MQPVRLYHHHTRAGVLSLPYQSPMTIEVQMIGNVSVLALHGALTADSRAMLREQASGALAHSPCVILDLAGVTFIDSVALATLVDLVNRARNQQSVVWLADVPSLMRQVLFIASLDHFFDVYEDVDAALDAWQRHARTQTTLAGGDCDWQVVKMPRALDASTMTAVVDRCMQSLTKNVTIMLDFSETAFLSQSGRALMLKLKRVMQESEGRVRFVGCSTELVRAFQLMVLPDPPPLSWRAEG